MEKFSKAKAIAFGWEAMKKNFWFFFGLLIVAGLIQIVPNSLSDFYKKKIPMLSAAFGLVSFIASNIVAIGLIKISLKLHDNTGKPKLGELFAFWGKFFKYLFSSLLYGLLILVGLILLIVPGIIVGIRCQFFGYLIIDKNMGPVAALKKSFAMTRGNGWNLFLFGLLLTGISLLGALALLVGLFAALPTTIMAGVFVYRFLIERAVSPEPVKAEAPAVQQ